MSNIGFGPLADHARGDIRACMADACRQGKDECPTPDACRLPADDDDGLGVVRGFLWAMALTLGCVALAAAIAWALS